MDEEEGGSRPGRESGGKENEVGRDKKRITTKMKRRAKSADGGFRGMCPPLITGPEEGEDQCMFKGRGEKEKQREFRTRTRWSPGSEYLRIHARRTRGSECPQRGEVKEGDLNDTSTNSREGGGKGDHLRGGLGWGRWGDSPRAEERKKSGSSNKCGERKKKKDGPSHIVHGKRERRENTPTIKYTYLVTALRSLTGTIKEIRLLPRQGHRGAKNLSTDDKKWKKKFTQEPSSGTAKACI